MQKRKGRTRGMVETKERYEDTLLTVNQWIGEDYQKALRETIEALRDVAIFGRDIAHHVSLLTLADNLAFATRFNRFEAALDALPDWLTEE